jgi:Zn-dependent protease
MNSLQSFLPLAPGILAALTVHEFSHGWMAYKLGDNTAKDMGRLTLNPLAHLDPIGTIMLFLVHFGWAKPVPVNPYNFRGDIRKGMVKVALAGPVSNVIFAAVQGVIFQFMFRSGMIEFGTFGYRMFTLAIFINLMLAFFNMIPIPPLDGSKVVAGLLPPDYLPMWDAFERKGSMILMGLILVSYLLHIPIFGSTIFPIANFFYQMFAGGAPLMF